MPGKNKRDTNYSTKGDIYAMSNENKFYLVDFISALRDDTNDKYYSWKRLTQYTNPDDFHAYVNERFYERFSHCNGGILYDSSYYAVDNGTTIFLFEERYVSQTTSNVIQTLTLAFRTDDDSTILELSAVPEFAEYFKDPNITDTIDVLTKSLQYAIKRYFRTNSSQKLIRYINQTLERRNKRTDNN